MTFNKTFLYIYRIIHNLNENCEYDYPGEFPQKPQAVIIVPTRNLTLQIRANVRKFTSRHGHSVKTVVVYGGLCTKEGCVCSSVGFQLSNLFKGCNILIATPGRLLHFVENGKVTFENVKFLVLDEADKMLDLGFLPNITKIACHSTMPPKGERRTLMFSKTFPDAVQQMALDFLQDYLSFTMDGSHEWIRAGW